MTIENKQVIISRPTKTVYRAGDEIIKDAFGYSSLLKIY